MIRSLANTAHKQRRTTEKIASFLKLSGLKLSGLKLSEAIMLIAGLVFVFQIFDFLSVEVGVLFIIVGLADLLIIPSLLRKAMNKQSNDFFTGKRGPDKEFR